MGKGAQALRSKFDSGGRDLDGGLGSLGLNNWQRSPEKLYTSVLGSFGD
jgi:hypothetical protein